MVITEDDFKVPSELARQAVRTATQLAEWAAESDVNMKVATDFFTDLVAKLRKCFVERKSMKAREELMWKAYHKLRVSDAFQKDWEKFLRDAICQPASPTFFQYVSHRIFKELVKEKHRVSETLEDQASPITKEDENALRYVAGYVCRKVQTKLKSSSLPCKDDMILFISELSGDEWDETQGTEEWTNAIDRGGLWHIKDNTYTLFYLMEEEIRLHLNTKSLSAKTLNEGTREKNFDAILENEDLLFQWSLLSPTLDDNIGSIVLQKIAELYITIRGFAFANSCLELYKQRHKIKTQKSKALRKKLVTSENNEN